MQMVWTRSDTAKWGTGEGLHYLHTGISTKEDNVYQTSPILNFAKTKAVT